MSTVQEREKIGERLDRIAMRICEMAAQGRRRMNVRMLQACRAADSISGSHMGIARWNTSYCTRVSIATIMGRKRVK